MHLLSKALLLGLSLVFVGTTFAQTPALMTPSSLAAAPDGQSPFPVIEHTLANGLKLFMSVNPLEPRIMTNIAVHAGSKNDPAETTGLAHYLEHMLFKGTSAIGALDWEKESAYLQQISDLYEKHRQTTDPDERKKIYAQIDSVSNIAATLVAANEYDKLVSAMGAKATNAYTWVDQTVYVNDIPNNELERWMRLESERFNMVVLRLFHTELEAVYEEFNINSDRDFRKVFKAVSEELFPTHPYGTQTTIGQGTHLKNPSHVNIKRFFDTYYVPNNMAIVLSGDFDPKDAIAWAEKYFGGYKTKPVAQPKFERQAEVKGQVRREVIGQESPYVQLAWRVDGASSEHSDYANMLASILHNQQAGILDLDIIQQQKVLEAYSWIWGYEDYGAVGLQAKPREGQSLEEVEKLLFEQMDRLRKGDFPDWLPAAVIKDMKLSQINGYENNSARVSALTNAFVTGQSWQRSSESIDRMAKMTKQELVAFANKHLRNDNVVIVYKQTGDDTSVKKVDKPTITPVKLNRDTDSPFATALYKWSPPGILPEFVNFEKAIEKAPLQSGLTLEYDKNELSPTFRLYYIFEMGTNASPEIELALTYLPYLGTDKYTSEQLKQEFYKLGLYFEVSSGEERSYVFLAGLDESFAEGVKLFEHVMGNVTANPEALANVIADITQQRVNEKKNKGAILQSAMRSYARYGEISPLTTRLSINELKDMKAERLTSFIHNLPSYQHRIYYYGSRSMAEVSKTLTAEHKVPAKLNATPANRVFPELETPSDRVIFVDFPMVQAEVMMLSKGSSTFNYDQFLDAEVYNTYFGSGLSSIVFQEIRESKALAYSANAFFGSPATKGKAHYMVAYVGTQSDKMPDAMKALRAIVDEMPVSNDQIENARQSLMKRIESERITRTNIFFTKLANEDRGLTKDARIDRYERLKKMTADDIIRFQKTNVAGRHYTILVLGSRDKIDMEYLKSLGPVQELTLDQVFGE
jgi:predicted Zn-dependent peptidase